MTFKTGKFLRWTTGGGEQGYVKRCLFHWVNTSVVNLKEAVLRGKVLLTEPQGHQQVPPAGPQLSY